MMMELQPLSDVLGVEVVGLDLLAPISPDDVAELRHAFDEHHLLLFRGQKVDPDRHVKLSSLFGPPVDDLGEGRLWGKFSNTTAAGRMKIGFHADYTYTEEPIKGLSLHALELPGAGTTTTFVSGAAAWASLPEDLQRQVRDLRACHSYTPSVPQGAEPLPVISAMQPVRLIHPRTGKPVLYVTEVTKQIDGIGADQSAQLLALLFDHLYCGRHTYVHAWQMHDLVIGDNLALQHARDETDISVGLRTFQRVVLNTRAYNDVVGVTEEQRELQRAWRERQVAAG